jgi:hypothetical protein
MPLPVALSLTIPAMWDPLCQCQLDLRLLAERGVEADLQGVVTSYSARDVRAAYAPSEIAQLYAPLQEDVVMASGPQELQEADNPS